MRQTELSREQAALHDGMVQKRAIEQEESVDETLENDEKVARSAEIPDGPEEVLEDPNSQQRKPALYDKRKAPGDKGGDTEDPTTEVVKDPMLGRNIDISG